MVKLKQDVRVQNKLGLHTRPATAIVKILQNKKSEVFFVHKKTTINAKSILSILMLAAKKNTKITILAEGEDAEEAIDELVEAFDNKFGEDVEESGRQTKKTQRVSP